MNAPMRAWPSGLVHRVRPLGDKWRTRCGKEYERMTSDYPSGAGLCPRCSRIGEDQIEGIPIIAADPIMRGGYGVVDTDGRGRYWLRLRRPGDDLLPMPGPSAVEQFRRDHYV